MATNISKVYLLNVPLEDDMKNTLYFASASAQHTYFNSQIGKTYLNVSYQSDTRTFRCKDEVDTIRQYNYIMYQNTAYSNKWFYGFIKKMTFVSGGYTDVEFEIDPLQTYMFDITVKPSFIEREHTNNDTAGNNTLPENVELGSYVKNSITGTPQIGTASMMYAVGVSDVIGTLSTMPTSNINGLPNGLYYVFVENVSSLHTIAEMYDKAGKAEALYTMFVFPKQILYVRQGDSGTWAYTNSTWSYNHDNTSYSVDVKVPTSNNLVGTITEGATILKPTTVGQTYVPRNQKLFTYPYCYFNITNNAGTNVTYRYEDFNGNPKFNLVGVFDVGCSTKLYPTNYKNMSIFTGDVQDNPFEYGITGGKYPTISWNSDSFTNWLTQNAVNIGIGLGTTALATAGGIATGNYAGATTSFLGGVSSTISQVYQASLMPDQAKGNTNVGDLNYTKNKNKFTVFELSIKPEYARIIDDYFDLFGYKTCRVKTPYVAHRQNWWYIKTINANIVGNVPNDEMNKIKEAYNNGLTFWRNPSNFLNYSVSNGVV
jgi:hypothetical protein